VSATIAALYVDRLGTIMEIIGKISSLIVGPLVAMFFLGVLTRRANTVGVFLGTLIGLACTAWVAGFTDVFWSWYGLVGFVTGGGSGYIISIIWNRLTRGVLFNPERLSEP